MSILDIPNDLPLNLIELEIARVREIMEAYGFSEMSKEDAYWFQYRRALEARAAELILLEENKDD